MMKLQSFLMFFIMVVYFNEALSQTIYNSDGTVYMDSERAEQNRAAARRANDPAANIKRRTQNSSASAQAAENPGGSVTRMAGGCIDAPIHNGLPGAKIQVCSLTAGGIAGDTVVYLLDGKEFDGKVRKRKDGSYELTPSEILEGQKVSDPELNGQFNCKNNRVEMQCLVCSCFFEARGVSFS